MLTLNLGKPNIYGMEANTLIKNFGGIAKTAEFFGIAAPSVHEWKTKNRIPPLRVFQLRERRPDLFNDAGADTVSVQPITIVTSPVTTRNRDTNPAADNPTITDSRCCTGDGNFNGSTEP